MQLQQKNKLPKPTYTNRKERNEYFLSLVENHFKDITSICNVGGGGKRYLASLEEKKIAKVTEIDFVGDNDFNLNLDKIERLPFADNTFDCTIALDVLEHLENFHLISKEIVRVSKKYSFISLPNSSQSFFPIFLNSKRKEDTSAGLYNKFYGLPVEIPLDRHRWFLTVGDIERYFLDFGKNNNCSIKFLRNENSSIVSKIIKFFLSKRLKKEFFTTWIWIIIKKN